MSTEMVKREPDQLAVAEDIVVLARDPQEMADAQQGLVVWMDRKITVLKQELAEAEENLATAKRLKHRTEGWRRQVNLAQNRVTYYEKAKAALEEGYCIIPDFPIDLIAVKTKRRGPPRKWHSGRSHGVPDIQSQALPEGEGEYVSPVPTVRERELPMREGEHFHRYQSQADEFQKVDFPLKVVKPQILKGMETALKRKLFDEIGILPQTGRGRDPVLVGRIKRKEGSYNEPTMCFLIAWWIDTRDL